MGQSHSSKKENTFTVKPTPVKRLDIDPDSKSLVFQYLSAKEIAKCRVSKSWLNDVNQAASWKHTSITIDLDTCMAQNMPPINSIYLCPQISVIFACHCGFIVNDTLCEVIENISFQQEQGMILDMNYGSYQPYPFTRIIWWMKFQAALLNGRFNKLCKLSIMGIMPTPYTLIAILGCPALRILSISVNHANYSQIQTAFDTPTMHVTMVGSAVEHLLRYGSLTELNINQISPCNIFMRGLTLGLPKSKIQILRYSAYDSAYVSEDETWTHSNDEATDSLMHAILKTPTVHTLELSKNSNYDPRRSKTIYNWNVTDLGNIQNLTLPNWSSTGFTYLKKLVVNEQVFYAPDSPFLNWLATSRLEELTIPFMKYALWDPLNGHWNELPDLIINAYMENFFKVISKLNTLKRLIITTNDVNNSIYNYSVIFSITKIVTIIQNVGICPHLRNLNIINKIYKISPNSIEKMHAIMKIKVLHTVINNVLHANENLSINIALYINHSSEIEYFNHDRCIITYCV